MKQGLPLPGGTVVPFQRFDRTGLGLWLPDPGGQAGSCQSIYDVGMGAPLWLTDGGRRVARGLAFTPLVFLILTSIDLTTAVAVAWSFAPEAFATVAVIVLLFLLARRVVRRARGARQAPN
jgi:hypothetical protein